MLHQQQLLGAHWSSPRCPTYPLQALLCKRMGKKRIIAETGAGQHGVATVSLGACWLLLASLQQRAGMAWPA